MLILIQSLLSGDYDALRIKLAIVAIMWLLVVVAIGIDLISGWQKAKERGEARTSYGLRRTVSKTVLYFAMMLFSFMFDCIGMFFYTQPYVTLIAAAFLILIECKSILEKAHDKDKRKMEKSIEDLSIIIENRTDLIKGISEIVKRQLEDQQQNEKDK